MSAGNGWDHESSTTERTGQASGLALAIALATLTAVGVGIAVQQIRERRLSKPEKARLRFYRYLRERGHLES